MKKIALLSIAIIFVLALVSAVILFNKAPDAQEMKPVQSALVAESFSAPEEILEPEAVPAVQAIDNSNELVFEDMNIARDRRDLVLTGLVLDSEKTAQSGLSVSVFCGEKLIKNSLVCDQDGKFQLVLDSKSCKTGDALYVTAEIKEDSYVSSQLKVPKYPLPSFGTKIRGSISQSESGSPIASSVVSPVGVPEFSLTTLLLAILVGGIGLVYLRKH